MSSILLEIIFLNFGIYMTAYRVPYRDRQKVMYSFPVYREVYRVSYRDPHRVTHRIIYRVLYRDPYRVPYSFIDFVGSHLNLEQIYLSHKFLIRDKKISLVVSIQGQKTFRNKPAKSRRETF